MSYFVRGDIFFDSPCIGIHYREESMMVPQRPCIWHMKLEASGSPGCGCLCELVRDWDVNDVMNHPIRHSESALLGVPLEVPHQSAPTFRNTTVTAVHFLGCHCCVWVPYHTWIFEDGSDERLVVFIAVGARRRHKLCWRKAQVPLALFAAWWTCGYHDVGLWRDMLWYLVVSASVIVWPCIV